MRLTEELYENATGERYERASSSGGGAQNLPGRPLDARSPPYTPEGERAIRRPRPGRHPQYGGSTIARGIDRPTGDGLRAQRRGIRSGGQMRQTPQKCSDYRRVEPVPIGLIGG
jgi:hypothetical protein